MRRSPFQTASARDFAIAGERRGEAGEVVERDDAAHRADRQRRVAAGVAIVSGSAPPVAATGFVSAAQAERAAERDRDRARRDVARRAEPDAVGRGDVPVPVGGRDAGPNSTVAEPSSPWRTV